MNAHLEAVPGLGTLTARGLAGSDGQALGRQTDRALGAEVLVLGTVDDLGADLLEDLDLARRKGDADLVALLYIGRYVSGCCFKGSCCAVLCSAVDASRKGEGGN